MTPFDQTTVFAVTLFHSALSHPLALASGVAGAAVGVGDASLATGDVRLVQTGAADTLVGVAGGLHEGDGEPVSLARGAGVVALRATGVDVAVRLAFDRAHQVGRLARYHLLRTGGRIL